MTTSISPPQTLTRDLYEANWVPGNTLSVTPKFSTGWWDHGNTLPQVCITDFDEFGPGTTSQYSGFMGDGSGPFQRRLGLVWTTVFAVRDPDRNTGPNPKNLVWLMARECMRIIHANVYTGFPTEFDQIAPGDLTQDRLPDKSPTVFFAQFPVVYTRTETP